MCLLADRGVRLVHDGQTIFVQDWKLGTGRGGFRVEAKGVLDPDRHGYTERPYRSAGAPWLGGCDAGVELTLVVVTAYNVCGVDYDDLTRTLRFVYMWERETGMAKYIVLERPTHGGFKVTHTGDWDSGTEEGAIASAERAAADNPGNEYYVVRAITRSKSTRVTTERL
jgi:hypothetical protein